MRAPRARRAGNTVTATLLAKNPPPDPCTAGGFSDTIGISRAQDFTDLKPSPQALEWQDLDTDAAGNPLPESLQSGIRNLWTPR